MKILIAPDKFKGSLSATKVAESLAAGIRKNYPNAQIDLQPMADGGDGSIDLLNEVWNLTEHQVEVRDPLFREITASYFSNKTDAFIEMAKASGLALLSESERNPMKTTSFGTGELIFDAFSKGFKNINLFIGGSATNDGGIGIANALGYEFVDETGEELEPIGESLSEIFWINSDPLATLISKLNIRIICDVNNPFFGENGAAHVYARQKGADDLMIAKLDEGLENLAEVFDHTKKIDINKLPGGGAAGGIGGGMNALFNAELISGIDFFIKLFELENKIKDADFVISGEGQFDSQSMQGKVIGGLLRLCKDYKKPLLVVCGQDKLQMEVDGVQIVRTIMEETDSMEKAMKETAVFLKKIGSELDFTK